MSSFFILGSPRSGTTILRNVLRTHPQFECPEETFIYTLMYPFKTRSYTHFFQKNKIVQYHRELDGISEEEFLETYEQATSRSDLQRRYGELFLEKKGNPNAILFDKTPQNIFGAVQILRDFHDTKLIHIHRHPYNVIASIMLGRVIGKQDLHGAINTWKESVRIACYIREIMSQRLIHIRYEDLQEMPQHVLSEILKSLGVNCDLGKFDTSIIKPQESLYQEVLNREHIEIINELCLDEMQYYGYEPLLLDAPV